MVTEADAATICDAFHEEGELSAIIELRTCARTIVGWQPPPAAPYPVVPLRPGRGR